MILFTALIIGTTITALALEDLFYKIEQKAKSE